VIKLAGTNNHTMGDLCQCAVHNSVTLVNPGLNKAAATVRRLDVVKCRLCGTTDHR